MMNSDIRGKSQLCLPLTSRNAFVVVSSFLTMAQSLCQYRIARLLLPLTRGRDRRAFAEGQLPSFSAVVDSRVGHDGVPGFHIEVLGRANVRFDSYHERGRGVNNAHRRLMTPCRD